MPGPIAPRWHASASGTSLEPLQLNRRFALEILCLILGRDPGTACFAYMSMVLWLLGYPEQALQQAHKALSLMQVLGHSSSLAFALDHVAVIHLLHGEWLAVQERAQTIITLATTQEFQLWRAHATVLMGWALVAQGKVTPGLAQMQQGLATVQATGHMQGAVMTLSTVEVFRPGTEPARGVQALSAPAVDLRQELLDFSACPEAGRSREPGPGVLPGTTRVTFSL